MGELFLSFFAGILTVLAPCVLPLLPVIVGGSLATGSPKKSSISSTLVIIAGLVSSITLFTLLLKASTSLLGIPQEVWQTISAIIIFLFGVNFLFPRAWDALSLKLGIGQKSDQALHSAHEQKGFLGNFLLGAALGPVFNSCSPTYALIVAIILPRSLGEGLANLTAYSVGLGLILLVVSLAGRAFIQRVRPLTNPQGIFRKSIGVIFILLSLLIITGTDKKFQSYVLEKGWYDPIAQLEQSLKL